MPRYFFNVFDGNAGIDAEGVDLPDVYSAQAQAIRTSGELLRDLGARFWDGGRWRLEVCSEDATVLFVLNFWGEERSPKAADPEEES